MAGRHRKPVTRSILRGLFRQARKGLHGLRGGEVFPVTPQAVPAPREPVDAASTRWDMEPINPARPYVKGREDVRVVPVPVPVIPVPVAPEA